MATPRKPAAPAQTPVQAPVAPPTDAHAQVAQPAAQPRAPLIPGRAVALNRHGIPVQRAGAEAGVDQFWIPPALLKRFHDEGFDVEWKEYTIHGQHRADVAARQRQVGWEPVMTESYPGVFAPEFGIDGQPNKGPIIRGGLMLMERPMALSIEAKRDEKRKADDRVRGAKQQYNHKIADTSGAATAEYDLTAQRASYIRENVERVDIPQGSTFTPPVD